MEDWSTRGWTQDEIDKLALSYLKEVFLCKNGKAVDTTICYSDYLNDVGVNSDNYPLFFWLLEEENHWVVDSLLGKNDPGTFFKSVQPNTFIIKKCFELLTRWQRGGIYDKSLMVLYGLLTVGYKNPLEGWRIYSLTSNDVNNLGKHLDEEKNQMDPVNLQILTLLDNIASLVEPGKPVADERMNEVAQQANNIRGKFLDMTKHINEAIPDLLLKKGDYTKNEVAPEKFKK
ncbi:MAG: hypothetical protein MJB14_09795 [Spirochaetes bacterium]|nr:hypothetical protein [Spirochaetota bacterium]